MANVVRSGSYLRSVVNILSGLTNIVRVERYGERCESDGELGALVNILIDIMNIVRVEGYGERCKSLEAWGRLRGVW